MLSCRDMTELATAQAEGALSFGQRVRFWLHLAMCDHCRLYVRQLREMVRAVASMPTPVTRLSGETEEAALRQFRAWKESK
jgi:anti-sigma factor ChrR (cupin superfamily)